MNELIELVEAVQTEGRLPKTVYLTLEEDLAIGDMQHAIYRRTGKKPERSEIVQAAVRKLMNEYLS